MDCGGSCLGDRPRTAGAGADLSDSADRTGHRVRPGAQSGAESRAWAWAWVGCAQYFALEAIASLGFRGHYSYRNNYMSDLGAVHCDPRICSHWHALINTSFVLQGVLIGFGALTLPAKRAPGIFGMLARGSLLLSGLGVLLVGLNPEDVDVRTHIHGAMLNFGFGGLGILLLGAACLRQRPLRLPLALPGITGGVVALAFGLTFIVPNPYLNDLVGVGVLERMTAYPVPLMLAWFGLYWLRHTTPVSYSQNDV